MPEFLFHPRRSGWRRSQRRAFAHCRACAMFPPWLPSPERCSPAAPCPPTPCPAFHKRRRGGGNAPALRDPGHRFSPPRPCGRRKRIPPKSAQADPAARLGSGYRLPDGREFPSKSGSPRRRLLRNTGSPSFLRLLFRPIILPKQAASKQETFPKSGNFVVQSAHREAISPFVKTRTSSNLFEKVVIYWNIHLIPRYKNV